MFANISGYKPLPTELTIQNSSIHGLGVFAISDIEQGHDFGLTHVQDDRFPNGHIRTSIGGFVNHSDQPNIEAYETELGLGMRTIKPIMQGEELTIDYTPYYTTEAIESFKQ